MYSLAACLGNHAGEQINPTMESTTTAADAEPAANPSAVQGIAKRRGRGPNKSKVAAPADGLLAEKPKRAYNRKKATEATPQDAAAVAGQEEAVSA